jgi:hypothetical protein
VLVLEDIANVVNVEVDGQQERGESPPVDVLLVVGHHSCTINIIDNNRKHMK